MPFSLNDIVFGIAIPTAVVMAILFFAQRAALTRPYAMLLSIAVAFPVGYFPLSLGPLAPESHWHWIPATVIGACLVAALLTAFGSNRSTQAVAFTLTTLAAGWFLVPTWPDLAPSRSIYLATWPILTAGIAFFLNKMLLFRPVRSTASMLVVVCFTTSVLVILSDNLRFAQMALILAGVNIGVLLYSESFLCSTNTTKPHERKRDLPVTALAGLPIAISICGLLLVARVNSFSAVPLIAYLLPPMALIMPSRWTPTSAIAELENEHGTDEVTQPNWGSTLLGLWPTIAVCGIAILIAIASLVLG